MTDEPTNPESLYPPDPDRPEPVPNEPVVEVTEEELNELGEYLQGQQKLLLAHEARIGAIENFLAEVIQAYAVDESGSESPGEGGEDGNPQTIVDGSGNPIDAGGTEVPSDDQ